ncbi:hypothetical protein UFOVP602_5 [uncultured Caudovirales phage]|uniref:Uncharacterized protein n=1 Tax=uncultured Caudovirales phage TaxID=2100421 RepID=A0A6J5N268_9CAUD|nr:hypothetical protein UFOVP602_5 [uncultured Caudovirales phage]
MLSGMARKGDDLPRSQNIPTAPASCKPTNVAPP